MKDQMNFGRVLNPKLFGYDYFISFKLGFFPNGSQEYASDLADRLRKFGFSVFFSETEIPPGEELTPTLVKALKKSRVLVVVASEATLKSAWVRREVEAFRVAHPRRKIIPISVEGSIESSTSAGELASWLNAQAKVWIDESAVAVESGNASENVVSRVVSVSHFLRASTLMRITLFGVMITLISGAILTWYEVLVAQEKTRSDIAGRLASQSFGDPSLLPVERLAMNLVARRVSPTFETESNLLRAIEHLNRPFQIVSAKASTRGFAYDPSGRTFVVPADKAIIQWDAATGKPLEQQFAGFDGDIQRVAFSPDGTMLAATGSDHDVILWDAKTHQVLEKISSEREGSSYFLAFRPDSRALASPGKKGTAVLWDISPQRTLTRSKSLKMSGEISCVAYSPDGRKLATGDENGSVAFWDIGADRSDPSFLNTGKDPLNAIAFSPDGQMLATAGFSDTVSLWEIAKHRTIGGPLRHSSSIVVSLAFSFDGKLLASGDNDGGVILSHVPAQGSYQRLAGHTRAVYGLAFSPGHLTLGSQSDDDTIIQWDVSDHPPLGSVLNDPSPPTAALAFSPDGRTLVLGSRSGMATFWDVRNFTNQGKLQLYPRGSTLTCLVYSPDGKSLASASGEGNITLWDPGRGIPRDVFPVLHKGAVRDLAFSTDGSTLASSGDDGAVILWDVSTGKPKHAPLLGHVSYVWSLAFSPDGKVLVSGSYDGSVGFWDWTAQEPHGKFVKAPRPMLLRAVSIQENPEGALLPQHLDNRPPHASRFAPQVETRPSI